MSTEHQRYSIGNQAVAIAQFASLHGFEIVRTYQDEGISGLSIKRRKGLQQLIADVVGGASDFDAILVYDVSRWGRFQNPDQSAHYEFLCAEAGVKVEYCAELFANDGSMASTILKGLKRVMAAEYSRELSVKVAAAKTAALRRGHWQGGRAGYGLRRQMVSPDGVPGRILEAGEFKGVQGHHTILVPGPPEEVAVVRRIYRMFTEVGRTRPAIARILNAEGHRLPSGAPWSGRTVEGVLTNPKYLGDLVGDRTIGRLGSRRVRKDQSDWVRTPHAFQPIVSRTMFAAAAARIADRRPKEMTREAMVEALRRIHARHGKITGRLIDETPGLACSSKFRNVLGRTDAFYAAIGAPMAHPPRRSKVIIDEGELLRRLGDLLARNGRLNKYLIDADPALPASTTVGERLGGLVRAYAKVGFVKLSRSELSSPVGRARAAAIVRLEVRLT